MALPICRGFALFARRTAVLRVLLVTAKSGQIYGGRLPGHRPDLKSSVPENEQASDDEPSEPPGYGIIVTQQWLEEGIAEGIKPSCKRVHKVGVCPGALVRYAIPRDNHHYSQREERRHEPQRVYGEVVADKTKHYTSDPEYQPYKPWMHAVPSQPALPLASRVDPGRLVTRESSGRKLSGPRIQATHRTLYGKWLAAPDQDATALIQLECDKALHRPQLSLLPLPR
jgi:hypothetical protein